MIRLFGKLRRSNRGAAVIEFAIIAPTLLLIIFGGLEICYHVYLQAMLRGTVEKAGRDSGIEGGGANMNAIDAKVRDRMTMLSANATFEFERFSFYEFNEVAPPEPWQDANANGQWDSPECFEDTNGNGSWDGKPGQGGADDIVQYTVTMTYSELFPLSKFLNWPGFNEMSATTLLRNQPFGAQARASGVVCP